MNTEVDFKITHYPLMYLQGEEAYRLIEESDLANDLQKFCEQLVEAYTPDELPEPVEGEPPQYNYRFFWHFLYKNNNYRFAYTSGCGGLFSLHLIKYGEL